MKKEIKGWLDQLKDGKVPEPYFINIEYEELGVVTSAIMEMGFSYVGMRMPHQKYRGRGRHLNSRSQYSDYDSPEGQDPKIRVTLSRIHSGGNQWRGRISASEVKDV